VLEALEDDGDVFLWAGGADGQGEAGLVEGGDQVFGAGHDGEMGRENGAIVGFLGGVEGGEGGVVETVGPKMADDVAAGSAEGGGEIGLGHCEAVTGGGGFPGFEVGGVAVDENAVHVEDYGLGVGHGGNIDAMRG